MLKGLLLKAVVCGILCLLTGTSVISGMNGDILPTDFTKDGSQRTNQILDENSVICGYVKEIETGDPLVNVDVHLYWEDSQGNYGSNWTYTDTIGFYHFDTAAVEFRLYFYYEDYFNEHSSMMSVGENEMFWYNISLIPVPPETVFIFGFITDDSSGEPVEGASVNLQWNDDEGHYWSNYTTSNFSGYYFIGAIPGMTRLYVDCDDYYNYYSEYFFTQNNSLIWFNVSLVPYPPVSAVVCGYITDAGNGNPIPDASINLNCNTEYGSFNNYTNTNGIGFYSLGTIPGSVRIYVSESNYESTYSENYNIDENETLWINLSMEYEPEVTSRVRGYVVDNETYAAVRNAFVRFDWKDEAGHFYSEYTFTDQKGFYSIMAPKGTLQFLITGNGYTNQHISWFDIDENTEIWLNATLSPEITLIFTKPQLGIYIFNKSRFPLLSKFLSSSFPNFKPLIIGRLEITVNITKSTLGCNRVEFYIDNIHQWTDSEAPFTYYWNERSFSRHVIRAIAYDNAGPCTIETITVQKIL
jgi:hypothetical protein